MATVTAHPVIVRETGVEKEAFAPISQGKWRLRSERNADRVADDGMVLVPFGDNDRVAERVGHIELGTVRARRECRGPNSDGQPVKVGVMPGKWPRCQTAGGDFPHAGKCHVDCPILRHGDRSGIGRTVADVAELEKLAVGEDVFVRVLDRIAVERPQHVRDDRSPMGIGRVRIGKRTESLVRYDELTAVGAPSEPSNVVGRQSLDQPEPPDREIDHGQLPAKGVGHDQIRTVGTAKLGRGAREAESLRRS